MNASAIVLTTGKSAVRTGMMAAPTEFFTCSNVDAYSDMVAFAEDASVLFIAALYFARF